MSKYSGLLNISLFFLTAKTPYSRHHLKRTPLYNGHFSQEQIERWSESY